MLNYVCQFFKIRVVFHTLYLWNESSLTTNFCFISETSNSIPARSGSLKKIYCVENICANVLELTSAKADMWNSSLFTTGVVIINFMGVGMESLKCFWIELGVHKRSEHSTRKDPTKFKRHNHLTFFWQKNDQTWLLQMLYSLELYDS